MRLIEFIKWILGRPVYRFEIRPTGDKEEPYKWVFVGPNNEDICESESMKRRGSCEHGISLLRDHGRSAVVIDKTLKPEV